MRADWDRRAREKVRFCVCTTAASSPESFAASGERDLAENVLDGLDVLPTWRVLEIGCGVERLLRPMSALVARVVGTVSPLRPSAAAAGSRPFCPILVAVGGGFRLFPAR